MGVRRIFARPVGVKVGLRSETGRCIRSVIDHVPHAFSIGLCLVVALFFSLSSASAEGRSVHDQTLQALGGLPALTAVKAVEIQGNGSNFEPFENVVSETPIHTSDDTTRVTWQPASGEFHREVDLRTAFPFPGHWDFVEIFDGTRGYRNGRDGFRPSAGGVLTPARIGATQKDIWLLNPQFLVAHAVAVSDGPGSTGADQYRLALKLPDAGTIWAVDLDHATMLPRRITVTETDPLLGQVKVTASYDDWRAVAGITTPFRIAKHVDGALVRREIRDDISYSQTKLAGRFSIPEGQGAPDDTGGLYDWGWDMSHWFLRRAGMAAPADEDQSSDVGFLGVGNGVFQITGSSHHNLVIEGSDRLIVVDAPLYDRRSRAVLRALKERWPDKPVKQLILTHHHNDHVGGLQPYISAGAELVVPAGTRDLFDDVVKRTLGVSAEITAVTEHATLAGSGRDVALYAVPNSHANDMLVVYLPSERLLFNSDLFSPGRDTQHPLWAGELLAAIRFLNLDVANIVGGHGHGAEPLQALESAVSAQ